jgi:phenylpyruvate tautomerase PptA (4-oxalocrotonate tautomerase family)
MRNYWLNKKEQRKEAENKQELIKRIVETVSRTLRMRKKK